MDTEKIVFLVLAIVFTVVSMFIKSKKQKQPLPENEESDQGFFYPSETSQKNSDFDENFERINVTKMFQNSNISTKNKKIKQKPQKNEVFDFPSKTPADHLQDVDTERDLALLEDYEGTEIQKAFLYSEIFKNIKS